MVADRLAARTDGLVDYEELYRLLLKTPPQQVRRQFPKKSESNVDQEEPCPPSLPPSLA